MSRRSRSRVVTKVFTQADFRQDQETVVKQFHEQVLLPVPPPPHGPNTGISALSMFGRASLSCAAYSARTS